MKEYQVVTKSVIVVPEGEPIFSELATTVAIEDEAAGAFVIISQTSDNIKPGEIRICTEEWPTLQGVIEDAIRRCLKLK